MSFIKTFILIVFVIVTSKYSFTQNTQFETQEQKLYHSSIDLFSKKKYQSAGKQFDIFKTKYPKNEKASNAELYSAICKLKLFRKNADRTLIEKINIFPGHILGNLAYLELSEYYYLKRKWAKAIEYFEKINPGNFSAEIKIALKFKKAYSYFSLEKYHPASTAFYELKNIEGVYKVPSTYYYAHIAYENKEFASALKEFKTIENDKKFSFIAPYYIASILFEQKKYDQVISYLQPKINGLLDYKGDELFRMLGESYYKKTDYEKAAMYLERALENKTLSSEETYHLAFSYYKSKKYLKSKNYFESAIGENDSINQLSYYSLADTYIKLKKPKLAFNAFKEASKINVFEDIQEESAFSMAKISYETSLDPYYEAVNALTEFIKKYPESEKSEIATNYLINVFLLSKNYPQAIKQIETITIKNPKLDEAYQQVCYNHAIQLYNQKKYPEAIIHFDKAAKFKEHKYAAALSKYWIGEIKYKQKDYPKSREYFKTFIFEPGAIILNEFGEAHYNIAYTYFNEKDYDNAQIWYRKFIMETEIDDKKMLQDALVKTADIFYLKKDLLGARDYYKKAYNTNPVESDYSLYQLALVHGLLKKWDDKLANLKAFEKSHKNSTYYPSALWELANTYKKLEQNSKSLALLETISKDYPNSAYAKKTMLEKAQIYYNLNQNEKAINSYKEYITKYPNYNDASLALSQLKNIYTENENILAFKDYVTTLDFYDVSKSSIDSTVYEAAYLQFIDDNCSAAIRGFEQYLNEVNKGELAGIFSLQANFYKSECHTRQNNPVKAEPGYLYVINRPMNLFTENATLWLARNYYSNKDFPKALEYYKKVKNSSNYKDNIEEANVRLMYANYKSDSLETAIEYANKVLTDFPGIKNDTKLDAYYFLADGNKRLGRIETAISAYQNLSKQNMAYHSEALYNIADLQFNKQDYTASEENINSLLNGEISNQVWLAKALILLSDIYKVKDDLFLAKQTLLSVIGNHEGEAELKSANEKLAEIEKIELERDSLKNIPDSTLIEIEELLPENSNFIIEDE